MSAIISAKIEHLLIERKMSQKQLAELMGVSQSTLSSKMRRGSWKQEDIEKICEKLNCTFDPVFKLNDSGKEF